MKKRTASASFKSADLDRLADKLRQKIDRDACDYDIPRLHVFAHHGRLDLVDACLAADDDHLAPDERGELPIHRAASNGQTDVVLRLVDHDPGHIDATTDQAMYAFDQAQYTPMAMAIWGNHPDTVDALSERGANIQFRMGYYLFSTTVRTPFRMVESRVKEGDDNKKARSWRRLLRKMQAQYDPSRQPPDGMPEREPPRYSKPVDDVIGWGMKGTMLPSARR